MDPQGHLVLFWFCHVCNQLNTNIHNRWRYQGFHLMHESGFMLIRHLLSSNPNTSTGNKQSMASSSWSHLCIGQTTLGCRKQPVDSQIRSYREKQCSRKTRGRPPASLLSIQSPSSPRRRSSEGVGGGGRRSRGEEEAEKRKVRPALQSSTTNKVLHTRKYFMRVFT